MNDSMMSVIRIYLSFLNTLFLLRDYKYCQAIILECKMNLALFLINLLVKSGGFQKVSWVHVSSKKLRIASVFLHTFG